MTQKYVSKPKEVEAIQLSKETLGECLGFIGNGWAAGWQGEGKTAQPWIEITSGSSRCFSGDWIVKDDGVFKRYPDETFKQCFEPVR